MSVIAAAVGIVSDGIGDAFTSIFGGGGDDHGHQTHLADLWNQGKKAEFTQYYNSWISGAGSDYAGHVQHLKQLAIQIRENYDPNVIAEYNTYLSSFLNGVASPMTAEMFGLEYYDENGKSIGQAFRDFGNKVTKSTGSFVLVLIAVVIFLPKILKMLKR